MAGDFAEERLKLLVQGSAVARERTGSRLGRELLELIQDIGNIVQSAVDRLQDRGPVVRIANALLKFSDVGPVPIRDRQAGGVVTGVVNTVT